MSRQNEASCACTLAPASYESRVRAWRELAARALSRRVEPGRVESTYAKTADTAGLLAALVEGERECCSFLSFEVREGEQLITVEMRYPAEFATTLENVLAGF